MKHTLDQARVQLILQHGLALRTVRELAGEAAENGLSWEKQSEFARLQKRIGWLERALDREHRGKFGTCSLCLGPINPERLFRVPWAEVCMSCHQKAMRSNSAGVRLIAPAQL